MEISHQIAFGFCILEFRDLNNLEKYHYDTQITMTKIGLNGRCAGSYSQQMNKSNFRYGSHF